MTEELKEVFKFWDRDKRKKFIKINNHLDYLFIGLKIPVKTYLYPAFKKYQHPDNLL